MTSLSEKERCEWCNSHPLYIDYHDHEWGVPVYDDKKLFEMLVLESFQAGLNWLTILKKREHLREAFDNFDFDKILNYNDEKIDKLMMNKEIIRHRLKILSVKNNAFAFKKIQEEFGSFSHYIWEFVKGKPIVNHFQNHEEIPARTALSDKIAHDLKKRGFKFVGSTTIYAYMQAIGLVNDHTTNCFKHINHEKGSSDD